MSTSNDMSEYARFARFYDTIVGPPLHSLHSAMVRELVQHGCNTVLDLCCGTGLFLGMAQKAGLDTTGVDLSSAMLDVGRKKYPSVRFLESDASDIPLESKSFDAVTVSFGLHEKPDHIARMIFREGMRLVRPGGVMVVADYHKPEGNPAPFAKWAIRFVERVAGKEHYACFDAYMEQGGTVGFLSSESVDFELRRISMSGWAGLFVVRP